MALIARKSLLRTPSGNAWLLLLALAGLLGTEVLLGAMLPMFGPALTMMVAAVLISPVVLLMKAEHLVFATLLALFFTRILVLGGAPTVLNFAHFPLAIVTFIKLLRVPAERNDRFLVTTLLAFLAVTIFAAVMTSWQAMRPFLSWVTLAEPFIFFGLISTMEDQVKERIRNVALAIAAVQLPIALLQFASHGVGDQVQGTLIGQGAGHHIMGAMCVAAGWMIVSARTGQKRALVLLALPLLAVGILADAKQVYGALLVAVAALGLIQLRQSALKVVFSGTLLVGLVVLASQFYAPLGEVTNTDLSEQLLGNKVDQMSRTSSALGLDAVPLGLGPGNGLSRTALSSVPGYANVPGLIIGNEPAELAADVMSGYDTEKVSSAASPFSSWLGMYTDLGVLGLVSYLALVAAVIRQLAHAPVEHRQACYTLLLLAAVLGYVFTWLEEPGFTVFLAVLIATGLPSRATPVVTSAPATASVH